MVASDDNIMMHGGDLSVAIARFGGAREDWLDLSSGINKTSYPFDREIALDAIDCLPNQVDMVDCLAAARRAYGVPDEVSIVASPGTQSLIQSMPVLLGTNQSCLIIGPTYSEHQRSMARAGVDVAMVQDVPKEFFPGDCLLIVNPNNPDGRQIEAGKLIELANKLQKQRGLLIVDEAFADVVPDNSIVSQLGALPNTVVLRSYGKFFGMSGIRLGFLLGHEVQLSKIRDMLGPWAVSTPALRVGTQSLNDIEWQKQQRAFLTGRAEKLDEVLEKRGLYIAGGTPLFRLVINEEARALHRKLAEMHIWTRIFDYRADYLRIGIPIDDEALERLDDALSKVSLR